MDVGLFCDTYPFEIDGVGMVVKNYARELMRLGARCCMVVPKAAGTHEERDVSCKFLQYRGISLPVARQYRAGVPAWDFSYLLRRRDVTMDILHAHSPFGAGMEAIRLARIHDVPLVGTFHSKFYDDFYSVTHSEVLSHAGVKIILSFFNACDEVWTVNEPSKRILHAYGYERDIIVMPNGTEARAPTNEEMQRAQEAFHIRTDMPLLLFVGQQHWKKNIRHILEALRLYQRECPGFQMIMTGQGPDAKEIIAYAQSLGLSENVCFTGQVSDRSLLMGLYGLADMLVFPSLYDTAGLVVQEAAAAKTPALIVRGSCAAECIVDGESGFLCTDSPRDMCAVISGALSDRALLRCVGETAQQTIPVSWQNIMRRVVDRYEMLIERYDMRAIRMDGQGRRYAGKRK